MTATHFDIRNAPAFKDCLSSANTALQHDAMRVRGSTVGLQISEAGTDHPSIAGDQAIKIIKGFALKFGERGSDNYQYIVDCLCRALTQANAPETKPG